MQYLKQGAFKCCSSSSVDLHSGALKFPGSSLDNLDFADKAFDDLVDIDVGLFDVAEDVEVDIAGRHHDVFVVGLDELLLGRELRVVLLQLSVLFLLGALDFPASLNILKQRVHLSLLLLNLLLELCKQFVLLLDDLSVGLELDGLAMQLLFQLNLVTQQLVVVFSLSPQLVLDVLVGGLDHFLIGKQVFDFS